MQHAAKFRADLYFLAADEITCFWWWWSINTTLHNIIFGVIYLYLQTYFYVCHISNSLKNKVELTIYTKY